ncbi:multicopper oxidase domain-containing protein (plasmid) [Deinococcus sp. KNUC1210]|uniref:multicopper oxidase domain-containing protein n=1 Tax=Deinococcus sp. KNUC1210 TaxID=2917691 RepID=UPI001EF0D60D|nr:multicopper oxidase domain-containing protein [Deinococcus sp. KNUC1210]ULH17827.1 multicopper oxidase domain-containing protein [Deinococcus sp. KNUC1210]
MPATLHLPTLLLLGLIAGGTIFIGLPVGRMKRLGATARNALSMLAAGILLFLLVEILGEASGQTTSALRGSWSVGTVMILTMIGGLLLGFVGLVAIEQRLIRTAKGTSAQHLSTMIATAIGVHNLSEGLAIGQTYAQGKIGLSIGLIVGFALHNATEGFGIVGPSLCGKARLPWRTLLLLGLIGGGPTVVGTLLGSLWTNPVFNVFVLAMAGGAILYVLKELFASVRQSAGQYVLMTAVVLGFSLGWGTGAFAALSGSSDAGGATVAADGDVIQAASPVINLPQSIALMQQAHSQALLREQALTPTVLPDGTRQYTLTASAFPWQVAPGRTVTAWGYNGTAPGPLLRWYVGERVAVVLKNNLPQETSLHWHGLAVPFNQDGMPMVSQAAVKPGETFTYRFTVTPQMVGTHFYHSHVNDDFQVDAGLHGEIIVDAKPGAGAAGTVDLLTELSSFKVDGSEAENLFAINGQAYPDAPAVSVPQGKTVHLRLVNASAEETHVMHLHGYTFRILARDGNTLTAPESANTVTLGPSQTADLEFVANNPGTWMLQCHILDHAVNPGPGSEGSATHEAEMGGLVTFIRVVPNGTLQTMPARDLMTMSGRM